MSSARQTTTTRDALVAEIRKRILSGELAPGEPLTESGLAPKFKVARPTVRSALQVLASRHLAQQVGGRSLSVPVLGEADVRNLFFARTSVELEAVREIVENDRCLDGAEQSLRALEALPRDASWGDRVDAHGIPHRPRRRRRKHPAQSPLPGHTRGNATGPGPAARFLPGPARPRSGTPRAAQGRSVRKPRPRPRQDADAPRPRPSRSHAPRASQRLRLKHRPTPASGSADARRSPGPASGTNARNPGTLLSGPPLTWRSFRQAGGV